MSFEPSTYNTNTDITYYGNSNSLASRVSALEILVNKLLDNSKPKVPADGISNDDCVIATSFGSNKDDIVELLCKIRDEIDRIIEKEINKFEE